MLTIWMIAATAPRYPGAAGKHATERVFLLMCCTGVFCQLCMGGTLTRTGLVLGLRWLR